MPDLDESASAIVEMLTRLDLRLSGLETRMDAVLAVMSRPAPAQGEAAATTVYDRRKAQVSFDGVDRRMGEI